MKITRRQSIKTIASLMGAPLLLGKEAVAQETFQFSEGLEGFIALDQTDGWHKARAIYDFERGKEQGEKRKSEISFKGSVVIDDLDAFEKDPHIARFKGDVTYSGEENPINKGQVRLFTRDPAYNRGVRYLVYELPFSTTNGQQYVLSGYKQVMIPSLNPLDFLDFLKGIRKLFEYPGMTTLYTHLYRVEEVKDSPGKQKLTMLGAGILRFDMEDLQALIESCKPKPPSPASRKFLRIVVKEIATALI